VPEEQTNEALVACGEACANVVQHAYSGRPEAGDLLVEARLDDDALQLWVHDDGEWRRAAERGGGWGLQLMHALMDEVEVEHTATGTTVHLCRRVTRDAPPDPAPSPAAVPPDRPPASASGEASDE
jgi:anti-sigma regulatory factor (Ser/Thr protein kinase)